MSKVVVFGSLNMDLSIESDHMPVMGETIMGRCFITNPGGKGANQAGASAKLGAEVVMLGAVGEDAFGDQMIAALAEEGVQCDRIERVRDLATGVALITRVQGDNFIVLGSGANAAPSAESVRASLDEVARGGDVFLAQLECDFDATMEALRDAHDRGMYTVLNPAPARQLPEWVYSCLDMVVVNESECEILTGLYPEDEASAKAAMEKLSSFGVGTVVVTLGERGSVVLSRGKLLSSVPPKVDAVDTTCAGDTYIGALVASYARGVTIESAIELATKASAMATTKIGAQQSIPHLEDVE